MPDPGCAPPLPSAGKRPIQALASHDRFPPRPVTGSPADDRKPRPRAAFTAEPARRQECHAQISRFGTARALAIHPGRQLQVGEPARSYLANSASLATWVWPSAVGQA
jgi:hypothetical protein